LQSNLSRMVRRAQRACASGDLAAAERLFDSVLQQQPGNFDALHGLGQIHYGRGRLDTALVLIQEALKRDRARADGFASLGLVFHGLRHFKEALASYDEGLCLAPNSAELLSRRGVALLELRRPDEALQSFELALAADADHLDALGNCGNALLKLNRVGEALSVYDRALGVAPENAQLLTNRAVALRRLDRPQEALMSASRALVARPDFAQARFVEALARLTLGDFAAGWRAYEARWSVGLLSSQRRNFAAPPWFGKQSLEGKTILLHAEQGSGDTIQFARYAPLLAARGAKEIIVEVQRELVRLVSAIKGIGTVIGRGAPLPDFDMHCPLLSLPLAFSTELATIPADVPYIAPPAADARCWSTRLPRQRPLIGVVWSGDAGHDNDLNRSLRLATLSPLLGLPVACFVSLQHVVREADAPALRGNPNVIAIGEQFSDFADTAGAIAALDAVISVDTAVAHLAGAMGKPLMLLLPFGADFRWMRERQDSPWYPTARLYRQPKFGDWDSVIAALAQDLTRSGLFPVARKLSA
jgi:tetratricopeptide (TPR) repeat protein